MHLQLTCTYIHVNPHSLWYENIDDAGAKEIAAALSKAPKLVYLKSVTLSVKLSNTIGNSMLIDVYICIYTYASIL